MMLTDAAVRKIEEARWTPDPETVAALKFVIQALTRPESDGLCMIERVLLNCHFENQRNEEIRAAGFAILGKRFKDRSLFFHVDCSDTGVCRFALRMARAARDLHAAQPATEEWFANLLRPREEWVTAPRRSKQKAVDKPKISAAAPRAAPKKAEFKRR